MKKLLLASTSTLFGENYLEYLLQEVAHFFKEQHTITFIPFARPGGVSHDTYTQNVEKAFAKIGKKVVGLHSFKNVQQGLEQSEALFTGGGNTFLLVWQLYGQKLMQALKEKVENGTPYMGTSAGSNIAGPTMQTTNDMPIIYPPSFNTLGLVNFNLNAHYLDPDPQSKHNGETRETRIKEYHFLNNTPVVGLREGNFILVKNKEITLEGKGTARVFKAGEKPYETRNLDF